MKKGLLLITLLILTTTLLFAQYYRPNAPDWRLVDTELELKITAAEASMAIKPGKFLDGGKTIWLAGHTTASPYSAVSFRSTDGGETWLKGTPVSGTRIANIDAIDANIAFMAMVNGIIYKTTDGGETWNEVHRYSAGGDEWFGGLKVLNNNVVIAVGDGNAAGNYYVCRSVDGGNTFEQIPYNELPAVNAQWSVFTYGTIMDAYGDNVWIALYQNTNDPSYPIVRSTDGGLTWDFSRINSTSRIWGISFTNDKVGIATNQGGTLYLTNDGGESWDTLKTAPTGFAIRNVTAVKGTNKFVLVGEYDNAVTANRVPVIYSTTDNGKTWNQNYVPIPETRKTADNFSACVYDDNLGFAFFRNNLAYKLGAPKVTKNFNVVPEVRKGLVYKPGAILDNGNIIWFCGHEVSGNTYSFVSTDGGKTFKEGTRVTGRTSNIVAYNGTTALMATAQGWIIRTTDGGTTWTNVFQQNDGDPFFNGIQIIGPDVVVAYGDGTVAGIPYFCKSTDKGLTWAQIPREDLPEDLGTTLWGYQGHGAATASYGSHAWFTLYGNSATYSYVLKTSDYGQTWKAESVTILGNTATNGRIRSISFPTDRYGMVVTLEGGIFLLENTGNLWVKVKHPSEFCADQVYIFNVTGIPETKTFIAGGVILSNFGMSRNYAAFITYDLGQTWEPIPTPLSGAFTGNALQGPNVAGQDFIHGGVYLNENFGYAFTNGGWVLKLDNGPTTNVPQDPNGIITVPKDYTLDQNYPNPFNPATTIKFKLNKTEHVKLVIYDALGKEVRTLVDNNIIAGEYSVVFSGEGLSSGVYFYTLKVGNALETKKMVLMK